MVRKRDKGTKPISRLNRYGLLHIHAACWVTFMSELAVSVYLVLSNGTPTVLPLGPIPVAIRASSFPNNISRFVATASVA